MLMTQTVLQRYCQQIRSDYSWMVMMKFAFSSEWNPKTFEGLAVVFQSHVKDTNVFAIISPPKATTTANKRKTKRSAYWWMFTMKFAFRSEWSLRRMCVCFRRCRQLTGGKRKFPPSFSSFLPLIHNVSTKRKGNYTQLLLSVCVWI